MGKSGTLIDCQTTHDLAVSRLADSRFCIDDWTVRTNTCSKPGYIFESATPDIVAECDGRVVAIGEVETMETISQERAEQWKSFGETCVRFYIYVPEGAEETTARLIAKHKVMCAGVRSYSLNEENETKRVDLDQVCCNTDDHPWWLSLGSSDYNCSKS
ncbi:MAG: hypothetical protein ABFD64_03765 [Armatimonadota bacterium]